MPNASDVQACWNGFEHERYNFRFWLLHTDLVPMQAMNVLGYTRFQEDVSWERNDIWSQCPFDTTFYKQNVLEWQAALGATTKVDPKDIHKILYNLEPMVYFRQMKRDSLRQNTFIQALKASKPLLDYLNYAKNCEYLMGRDDLWDETLSDISFEKQVSLGESVLKNTTLPSFVRERTAYQLVKLSHYTRDTARTMALYKQYFEKSFYHSILETNNPQAVAQIIDIVTRKEGGTDFERWLAAEPKPYERYRSEFDRSKQKPFWSISKLKDYQSTIYIRQDELDSAYAVLKTIPEKHWSEYPYSTYLIGNPFQYTEPIQNNGSEERLPKAQYSKTAFVKKVLELKQQLKSDPIKFEQNYFFIGMAYYNMTHNGNYWLMSEIAWYRFGDIPKRTDWNDIYFGGKRAADWFAKGVANCVKKENAAICCFMANVCQQQQDTYEYNAKYAKTKPDKQPDFKAQKTPLWSTLRTRFKDTEPFENPQYWCQHLNEWNVITQNKSNKFY
jgi:hypothetical protein